MDAMKQCYNKRMGDGAPGQFRKIKSAYFMQLGMILARGSAKILRVGRGAVRLRQQHNFGDVGEDGFYGAMGDMGAADGEFLRGDAEEDGGVRLDADAPEPPPSLPLALQVGDGPLLQ
jgi:hypothetical protein